MNIRMYLNVYMCFAAFTTHQVRGYVVRATYTLLTLKIEFSLFFRSAFS